MTKSECAKILGVAKGLFTAAKIDAHTLAAWYFLLRKFEADDVQRAVAAVALETESPHLPAPARIARMLGGGPDAQEVLAEIRRAIRDYGTYRIPPLSAPAQGVVDAMGWRNLCSSTNPEAMTAQVLKIAKTTCARSAAKLIAGQEAQRLTSEIGRVPG